MNCNRRSLITGITISAAALMIKGSALSSNEEQTVPNKKDHNHGIEEVTATEDLMREHGILRRALIIYSAAAIKLNQNQAAMLSDALQKTAKLFRNFGEDYHEKMLEETYIFPAVKILKGEIAKLSDILIAQHRRGREITDYILKATSAPKIGIQHYESLVSALESFVWMYRSHAAREDTIIFPAWKKTLSEAQLSEMGEQFEEIEHKQFGEDGFEDAKEEISRIESELDLADLNKFTAPPPPSK